MMKIRAISLALALAILTVGLSGCANWHYPDKMPLVKGQKTVDVSKESIGLLFVRVSNQYHPGCQPKMWRTDFVQNLFSEGSKVVRHPFWVKAPYRSEKKEGNEYLLTVSLDPGNYDFIEFISQYNVFPVSGVTYLYLKTQVDIKPNAVIYLGHIDAVIRERKNEAEVRAGIVLPLIDQAITGFYNGAYDVSIEDRFDDDIKLFTAEYPGLQKIKIEKAIIPPSTKIVDPQSSKFNKQMDLHRN